MAACENKGIKKHIFYIIIFTGISLVLGTFVFAKEGISAGDRRIFGQNAVSVFAVGNHTTQNRKVKRLQRGNATERHERNRSADGTKAGTENRNDRNESEKPEQQNAGYPERFANSEKRSQRARFSEI